MQKYLPELLKEINEDPSLLQKMKGDSALTLLFRHAFDPEFRFALPEGEPPYKKDAAPIGMSPAILRQELKRFYVFCRQDLTAPRREDLFIQLLEGVHPSEAELLLAIKDQILPNLYPNITHKAAFDNGFVANAPTEAEKKKRGRPAGTTAKKSTGAAE